MHVTKRWFFLAAAVIPCGVLLLLCGVAIHEWWLISTHQIVVIPAPRPGDASEPEVPAARLLPLILGSGAVASMFAYAVLRDSRRALISAYLVVFMVIGVAFVRHMP